MTKRDVTFEELEVLWPRSFICVIWAEEEEGEKEEGEGQLKQGWFVD